LVADGGRVGQGVFVGAGVARGPKIINATERQKIQVSSKTMLTIDVRQLLKVYFGWLIKISLPIL